MGFKFFEKRFYYSRTYKKQVLTLSQSPVVNHSYGRNASAKVDLCVVNCYSLAREIINLSYFPNCNRSMKGLPK